MIGTNRLARYERLVPFDEVEELRADAFEDGWRDGYRNGMALWCVVGVAGVVFGWLLGLVV